MARVILENVSKYFNEVIAVKDFSLEIEDKEFVVFVGPSGCGKTTTLRMIAGLEEITKGNIYIGDRLINRIPAKDRDIAMVFQNYALYPHMTVYQNLAFSLEMRKLSKKEIDERVKEAADLLEISELLHRKPKQLSGGQRQRVAVGRTIVRKPQVFLFDEPLSNLDAKLRVQMRGELKKLHERLSSTIIYVTHDQVEAMTMGDRIVVMKDGLIQQVGKPLDLYFHPINKFVAGFIGSPTMNFIETELIGSENRLFVQADGFRLRIPEERSRNLQNHVGKKITLGIRPQDLSKASAPVEGETIEALVEIIEPIGNEIYLDVKAGRDSLIASVDPKTRVIPHQKILLQANLENIHLFDPDDEKALL
ncbi:MAG: ABC transporter ATP-binding protein [Syntrophaceae bacterium]|nr:ABC transporter ATP-binding protein [Syntrophaceae bacterium]